MSTGGTASPLSDDDLFRGFAEAELEASQFGHREHVRVAWLYLERYPPAIALARYAEHIRRLATAHGAPEHYHETITWAFLLLIRERMEAGESWDDFAGRAQDLLERGREVLGRYYSPGVLATPRARERFVLPDRLSS